MLLRALRLLRNSNESTEAIRDQTVRHYQGYLRQMTQLQADIPQSITGFPNNKNLGEQLEGLVGLIDSDQTRLGELGASLADLNTNVRAMRAPIEQVRATRRWVSGARSGYNDFQPADLEAVMAELKRFVERFPISAGYGEISEDAPVRFNVPDLPDRIHEVALATGGQALANVEPLINRIQVMLSNPRLVPVIETKGADSLEGWLSELLGPSATNPEALAVLDLSLVPSDVVHVAIAVIARLIFEALQRHMKLHGEALPTVLVLEEAHFFVRKEADQGASQAAADVCRQVFERIAREGRKFGLGLVLASQRPSELSPSVLTQCNSFLLHRIVNDVDQNLVRRLVPDALGGLLGELPTLPSQQAILLGWAVATPVLVRIRDLDQRPRSADPQFWNTWLHAAGRLPLWKEIAASWERSGKVVGENDASC